jgi:UDP-N-acetylmuramate dehydrogenase
MTDIYKEIKSFFKGEVLENEILANHVWYQIGGPCDYFCIPEDIHSLKLLVDFCESKKIDYFVLGKGSNLLISDSGIRGIVISLSKACSFIEIQGNQVKAGAGVQSPKLVLECEKNGLGGTEMFAGIPGSIGGLIKMNAGCHGKEIFDVVTEVTFLNKGKIIKLPKEQIEYSYRHVKTFDDRAKIILSATINLEKSDIEILVERRKQFMKIRQDTQPINLPSLGSVFKNPKGNYAARLIEETGLKGFKVGDAMVSTKHSNFIVNEGNAKANDVLEIISNVRRKVKEKFGVFLELEIILVGFKEEELKIVN